MYYCCTTLLQKVSPPRGPIRGAGRRPVNWAPFIKVTLMAISSAEEKWITEKRARERRGGTRLAECQSAGRTWIMSALAAATPHRRNDLGEAAKHQQLNPSPPYPSPARCQEWTHDASAGSLCRLVSDSRPGDTAAPSAPNVLIIIMHHDSPPSDDDCSANFFARAGKLVSAFLRLLFVLVP